MATNRPAGVQEAIDGWAWTFRFTDPSTGEHRSASGFGHRTADDAALARHEALLELTNIRPRIHTDMTLCAWLRRWAQDRAQTVSASTASTLHSRVHQVCKTSYQKALVRDLDGADVTAIIAELWETSPTSQTLVAKVRCLCSALDAAVAAGIIEQSPTGGASAAGLARAVVAGGEIRL